MTRPSLKKFRRIVVKVGSSLLIDSDAGEVRTAWLAARQPLHSPLAALRESCSRVGRSSRLPRNA